MEKKLTIIIPVYNNKSVRTTLESVRAIKNNEIELVVIDGKSTDGTDKIIMEFEEIIDVFISEKDRNVHEAINKGIDKANSEWIFTLAADDKLICDPIKIINKYGGECDLICGNLIIDHGEGKYLIGRSDADLSQLEIKCILRHPATFFKKSTYDKYGKYDESLKCAGDRDIFLRLYKKGAKIRVIKECIVLFQIGGISTRNPIKYAYKEDVLISDRYQINKIKTRIFYIKRCLLFYGHRIKDILGIKHKLRYLSKKDLFEELKGTGVETDVIEKI